MFVGLFLLLALGMVGLPWRLATDMPEGWNTRALLSVVRFLPGLGYLWALWAVQRALADLSAGRLFHPTVARAMRHIGIGVLAGALLNVFAVTNLSRWIAGGQGGYLYFEPVRDRAGRSRCRAGAAGPSGRPGTCAAGRAG